MVGTVSITYVSVNRLKLVVAELSMILCHAIQLVHVLNSAGLDSLV